MFEAEKWIEEAKNKNLQATIIIPTFNRLEYTKRTIQSFLDNTFFPRTTIMVDNGSWDHTQEYLKSLRQENKIDKLILLPENVGIRGYNYGFVATEKTDFILPIANDFLFEPYWCAKICYVLHHIDNTGLVGVTMGEWQKSFHRNIRDFHGIRIADTNLNPSPGCMKWCCFEKVGVFRESGLFFAGMDTDYYLRTVRAGFRIGIRIDEPVIKHIPNFDGKELSFKMKDGADYVQWKKTEYVRLRSRGNMLGLSRVPYIGTNITRSEVEKHCWNP